MILGVSTSCYYPLVTEKSLEEVGKSGIKNTEIFFNALCELEEEFVNRLFEIKEFYGLNVTSVHPTMSGIESFMLFSAYERRYEEALSQYKRYAEIAARFGAEYIIMHGGKPNKVLDDEGYCERFYKIATAVKENGAVLLQENVVKYRAGNIETLKTMRRLLGEDANFCLDVKQSIRGGYSPYEVLETVGDRVRHLHLSDHNHEKDCLLPGKGDFDFSDFIKRAKELTPVKSAMIEVYRDAYNEYSELNESFECIKNFF